MNVIVFPQLAKSATSFKSVVFLVALVMIGVLAASNAHAASSAETFVQSNIDRTYAILNDGALSPPERDQQFRTLLLSVVDVRRVALFTLGPYARDVTQADIEAFEHAFADFLAGVYQRGLDNYASPKVTGSTERAPGDVIVNVTASPPSGTGPQLQLAFRVRETNAGGQAITDLQVEGAWLAIVQRGEFTAYLQQHRTNVAGLAMELEKRAAQFRLAGSEGEVRRRGR